MKLRLRPFSCGPLVHWSRHRTEVVAEIIRSPVPRAVGRPVGPVGPVSSLQAKVGSLVQ